MHALFELVLILIIQVINFWRVAKKRSETHFILLFILFFFGFF